MARPKMFKRCPECGADGSLRIISTTQQGHCRNRWCECAVCGAHIRWVSAGGHGRWVRIREINRPETPPHPCL